MDWLRGGGGSDNSSRNNTGGGLPPRQGQSPAPGRSAYSSVPQYGASNSSLPPYSGGSSMQHQAAPALPSRGQRPQDYNNSGAMPGQMQSRGGSSGQFEVVPTPVDSLVPRNVSFNALSSNLRTRSTLRTCFVIGLAVDHLHRELTDLLYPIFFLTAPTISSALSFLKGTSLPEDQVNTYIFGHHGATFPGQ